MNQAPVPGPNSGEAPTPAPRENQEIAPASQEQQGPPPEASPEQLVRSNDQGAQNQGQPMVLPTVDLSAVSATVAGQQDDPQASSSPATADDVDVIEKEWVDKAKSIINATEDDPRLQEQEINRLQQAYLEKRYGKKITKTGE